MAKKGNGEKKGFFSKKRNILILILTVALLVLGGAAAWAFIDQPLSDEEIAHILQTGVFHDNIRINGLEVGGLTFDQARDKVEAGKNGSAATFALTFRLDSQEWSRKGADLKATTDIEDVLEEAMLVEKSGSNWDKMTARNQLDDEGYDYTVTVTADPAALKTQVDALADEATTQPEEPVFQGVDANGKAMFSDEKTGYVVDATALLKTVQERFENQDFSPIQMSAKAIAPKATAEELRENTVLIGEFTTTYSGSSNRRKNVEKAAGIINNQIVQPGEVFDMNEVLGPRTRAGGWLDAMGIIGGNRYQLEPGGGVCQVSSTLFNAVMYADLKIEERWNHSLRSSYVPNGRDATISTGGKNFKFRNTRSGPVYIVAIADKSRSRHTVRIYGPPHPEGYTVQVTAVTTSIIKAKTITKADPTKPEGYKELDKSIESQNGATANTYVTYYKDGKQVGERKLLFTSKYNAVPYVYIVGTKPVPSPTPEPTAKPTPKPTKEPKPTVPTEEPDSEDS